MLRALWYLLAVTGVLSFANRPLRGRWSGQGKKNVYTDVTLDAAYVNGTGWAITKQQLGFGASDTIDLVDIQSPHAGFMFTAATTATGITLRAWTTGAAAGGALQEAATNLAGLNGLVVRIVCTGN